MNSHITCNWVITCRTIFGAILKRKITLILMKSLFFWTILKRKRNKMGLLGSGQYYHPILNDTIVLRDIIVQENDNIVLGDIIVQENDNIVQDDIIVLDDIIVQKTKISMKFFRTIISSRKRYYRFLNGNIVQKTIISSRQVFHFRR